MSARKSFKQLVKDFFSPESAEVNLGPIKLKYTDAMRQDIAQVLAMLREKRVLFANTEHEIWEYVFASLLQLRSALSGLSGKLQTKGPNDVKAAVNFMIDIINGYLAQYQADYARFMQEPTQQNLAPAHRERNWPSLGDAAEDLILLRKLLHAAIKNINQYAETGSVLDWEEPNLVVARHWATYARNRKLCPQCGFNMNYAYDDECPRCPNEKAIFKLAGQIASEVALAGSFSDWKPIKMHRHKYDEWIVRIKLTPGKYTYKFIVDGNWIPDPANPATEYDDTGNMNSVIRVD